MHGFEPHGRRFSKEKVCLILIAHVLELSLFLSRDPTHLEGQMQYTKKKTPNGVSQDSQPT